jgi:hypothetical protein
MKRTIKHPDGREEILEGSPAELDEYDRIRGCAAAPPRDAGKSDDYWKQLKKRLSEMTQDELNELAKRAHEESEKDPSPLMKAFRCIGCGQVRDQLGQCGCNSLRTRIDLNTEPCAFEGLPNGIYGLACFCPRCTPRCQISS